MPELPNLHAVFVICLTGLAMFLFTKDRIPLETTGLGVLVLLVLWFYFLPYRNIQSSDFFFNFGHEALVTICALLIVGRGLETTGALQPLATIMSRSWTDKPMLALFLTLLVGAAASAFLNNTPIVVMLLPVLVAVCLRAGRPPSRILMPMGLATLIGGMATTIGTSTNLLVVGIAADLGQRRFEMFDFTLPVVIAGGAGLIFLWLIAPRMLPERKALLGDAAPRLFSAVLYINEDGFAPGKTLAEIRAKTENRMRVDRIQRSDTLFVAKLPSVTLQPGDRLYVKDSAERLKEFEQALGATLYNASDDDHPISEEFPLETEGQQLAEVVITRGSPLHHRTLNAAQFGSRYGLFPLAIHRARSMQDVSGDLGTIRLRAGDVLLVQGARDAIRTLRESGSVLVLDATTDLAAYEARAGRTRHHHRGRRVRRYRRHADLDKRAMRRCADAVDELPQLARCRRVAEHPGHHDHRREPVARFRADGNGWCGFHRAGIRLLHAAAAGADDPVGLILLMTIMTNVVSNNAAAVIGTPVAISIAQQLGAPVEPFILAVIFGANMSFATPIGYHTNLLIMSAGGYRFTDFLRIGIPLTLIMWLAFHDHPADSLRSVARHGWAAGQSPKPLPGGGLDGRGPRRGYCAP